MISSWRWTPPAQIGWAPSISPNAIAPFPWQSSITMSPTPVLARVNWVAPECAATCQMLVYLADALARPIGESPGNLPAHGHHHRHPRLSDLQYHTTGPGSGHASPKRRGKSARYHPAHPESAALQHRAPLGARAPARCSWKKVSSGRQSRGRSCEQPARPMTNRSSTLSLRPSTRPTSAPSSRKK